jgi:hypothetical protein
MDKPAVITARLQMLGERLREACAGRNWQALARSDAELAQLLQGLDGSRLSPGERAALQQLQRQHALVRAECERELARVGQILSQMQAQRSGWQAYAESHSWTQEASA